MSEDKKVFPREVKVIAADNGYLVKIGCQLFVAEGSSKNITEDLKRYLDCDKTIIKKYGLKGNNAFLFLDDDMREEECCEEKCYHNIKSPAFTYLKSSSSAELITCVYKASNGKIVVDIQKETVLVYQKQFTDPKEVEI